MEDRSYPIDPDNRRVLAALFANHKRQRVIIDAVIEQGHGTAFANAEDYPQVGLLKFGYFTLLAGDPEHAVHSDVIQSLAGTMFIPEFEGWKNTVIRAYGDRLKRQQRVGFSFEGLSIDHLSELKENVPEGYELRRIEQNHVSESMGAHSAREFIEHGVGFCTLFRGRSVCEAYSYTQTPKAIEIETGTDPDHKRKGLATATCAALIEHSLQSGLEPHWNASNSASVGLAEKLGYVQDDVYEALFPWLK